MIPNIERIESGPAWMDKTSDAYGPDADAREREAAACDLRAKVDAVIAKGDANAICPFSTVTDWDSLRRQPVDQRKAKTLPRRAQTLAEVLNEVVNGYTENETALIQLLLNACKSSDTDIALQAGALRDELVSKWVEAVL